MSDKNAYFDLASKIVNQGLLDREHYLRFCPDLEGVSDLGLAEDYILRGESQGFSPSGLFDPVFYLSSNTDLASVDSLIGHYIDYGKEEGRGGSLAWQLIAHGVDKLAQREGLIPIVPVEDTDPSYLVELASAIETAENTPGYFSSAFYKSRHSDLGTNLAPLFHYLKYGMAEGRVANTDIVSGNRSLIIDSQPFIVVGVHEASLTGAPIVGFDLAKSLSKDKNVIFVTMKDGPLMEEAKKLFPVTAVVTSYSEAEKDYFVDYLQANHSFDEAIFSSVVCEPLLSRIAWLDCHVTCLVHEFLEYTEYFRNVAFEADLLVFSSRELLKSWSPILDDVLRPPESIIVLAQPASASGSRKSSKLEARLKVEEVTGLDLDSAVLVLGAGQIQMRKGTDIFIQIADQLAHSEGRYVCVWIGDQISRFELHYGVYLHSQIERSGDEGGGCSVHFEPAGPLYQVLMDAADVFLVTSRLDPLPNVALDAAARDLPVIAFRRATGLADLAEAGQIDLTEVGYAAVDEVVAAIQRKVPQSSEARAA